jgi:competence protein ComEC
MIDIQPAEHLLISDPVASSFILSIGPIKFRSVSMRKSFTLLIALLACPIWLKAQMKIHVIDVGQADSILLEFKSAAVLVDAGGESTGDDRDQKHLLSALTAFFAARPDLNKTLHAVIISHAHIDHTKLLMDVLRNFKVKFFYDGGDIVGSGAAQLKKARTFASAHGTKYLAIEDDSITDQGFTPDGLKQIATSSGADIKFLTGSRNCDNQNNNSLVVRVRYKTTTTILSGDSETEPDGGCDEGQVTHLLDRYHNSDLLAADIYKVGHHGSANGTDADFAKALSPKIAVISAGHKETQSPGTFHGFFFGHPREDIVEMLETETTRTRSPAITGYTYIKGKQIKEDRAVSKAIYCTCWDNDITIDVNSAGDQIAVSVANP